MDQNVLNLPLKMANHSNKKILEILVAEVLLQAGFERASGHCISTLTEILIHYIETLIKLSIPFKDVSPKIISKFLAKIMYYEEQYQQRELFEFLEQQKFLIKQIIDKTEKGDQDSLLHILRILPKGTISRGSFKNSKTLNFEDKKNFEVHQEIQLDDFMVEFIEKSASKPSQKRLNSFKFDCTHIIKEIIPEGYKEINIENISENKLNFFGTRDEILANQELFIEDFSEKKGIETHN